MVAVFEVTCFYNHTNIGENTTGRRLVIMQDNELGSVLQYLEEQMPGMISRLQLNGEQGKTFDDLFRRSVEANAARFEECLEAPYVEGLEVSQQLVAFLGQAMVGDGVEVEGMENLSKAIEFMKGGGNVLLVSNHTSGADTIVLHHVVNNAFAGAAREWLHMSGHAVNLFLLPLAVTGGMHRIQIFSAKYCAQASDEVRNRMKANNARALSTIGPQVTSGGKCIVLYPEGGRGEGALLAGEPRTMKIPQMMEMVSPAGLMVLPSYVDATDLLPVVRGEREFREFLQYARRGQSVLKFGAGVSWEDLQPTDSEVRSFLAGHQNECLGNPDHALKHCLVRKVMGRIASMAPIESRGIHN